MHPLVRKSPCKILPVLDIEAGLVVRAIAGKRNDYQPWHSPRCPTADPCDAARSLSTAVGHRELYVADLDALQGRPWQWRILCELAREAELWIDVGIRTVAEATRLARLANLEAGQTEDNTPTNRNLHVILASETCPSVELLRTVASKLPCSRLAFSLDMHRGRIQSLGGWIDEHNWLDLLREIEQLGIRDFILIDTSAVGTGQGVLVDNWCDQLQRAIPSARLIAGGGVSTVDHLQSLAQVGCRAALVASALHS